MSRADSDAFILGEGHAILGMNHQADTSRVPHLLHIVILVYVDDQVKP